MKAGIDHPDTINLSIEQGAQETVTQTAGVSRSIVSRAKNLFMTLQEPFCRVMHKNPDSPPSEPLPPEELDFLSNEYLPKLLESPLPMMVEGVLEVFEAYGAEIFTKVWATTPAEAQVKILQSLALLANIGKQRQMAASSDDSGSVDFSISVGESSGRRQMTASDDSGSEGEAVKADAVLLPHPQVFELRDYQKRVIAELYRLFRQGKRCPFIYAPTGAGKTAMASKVINDFVSKGHRILFIIHRDPLVPQTQEALQVYGIEAGIIKAGFKEDRSKQVQIGSIQSLARRQFPENIKLVIIDECHTTAWYATFERIKTHYPEAFFVGLTGSPWRTKSTKERMGEHFDSFVCAPAPAELIRMGYLARPRYFGFGGLIDLAAIDHGKDGDFNESQMQSACMVEGFNERVVEEYLKLCPERTAIAFCAGVVQSQYLAQLFNTAGISCEHLEADTPHSERREMYKRLASGETRVLSSVGTLTEGFDVPNISAVILARPTRSLALLFQMAGRGLRLAPNKKDCIMLDFGENFKRMGFLTDPQPITLEFIKEKREPLLKECPNCHAEINVFLMVCPECGYEFPPGEKHDDAEEFEAEFGELFSTSDKLKLKYLRAQIRTRYAKTQPIDRVWETFQEKFDHYPPNEWHLGSVFGTYRTEVNRQKYLDYLHKINVSPKPDWVKFHMELEFGKPGKQYQQSCKSTYTPPPGGTLEKLNWWSVLGVLPLALWSDIKSAYREKAMQFHPDVSDLDPVEATARMQIINWAFEQAQQARQS